MEFRIEELKRDPGGWNKPQPTKPMTHGEKNCCSQQFSNEVEGLTPTQAKEEREGPEVIGTGRPLRLLASLAADNANEPKTWG